jgi:hypothetical protein
MTTLDTATEVIYPDSDGKPMADSTQQWNWMEILHGELRRLHGDAAFVGANQLWYPTRGRPDICAAPDVYVVFGRPDGDRRSYKQWEEDGVGPQVTFEIVSYTNTQDDLDDALNFYERHGVQECYFLDHLSQSVTIYTRRKDRLLPVARPYEFVSPLLGIRFTIVDGEIAVYGPDGIRFLKRADRELELREQIAAEKERAVEEQRRANAEKARAEQEKARAEALAAKLRAAGIDPDPA